MPPASRVIVYPPSETGGRHVRVDGEILGVAYDMRDFIEFLRQAGIDPLRVSVTDPDLVEWRGAGPSVWRCGRAEPVPGPGPEPGEAEDVFPEPRPDMVDVTLDGPPDQVSRIRAWIESRAAIGSSILMELPDGRARCRIHLFVTDD
ncbi:hypothetical protein ABZZ36_37765 [Actinacidiphila glaucinigra]|uniref:hypothetical protein n=1 Tax=Actinacidiphila glaucinigra TaxID=235986 RepID=UPI0033A4F0F5